MEWSDRAAHNFLAARRQLGLESPEPAAGWLKTWLEQHLFDGAEFSSGAALVMQTKGRPKLLLLSDDSLAIVDVNDESGAVSTEYHTPRGGTYEEQFEETETGPALRVSYKSRRPRIRITETFRRDELASESATKLRSTLRRWASASDEPPPPPRPDEPRPAGASFNRWNYDQTQSVGIRPSGTPGRPPAEPG